MEVVVTTGAISRAKLQSDHHQQTNIQLLTGRMSFLSPNQQCQSTEGNLWLLAANVCLSALYLLCLFSDFISHSPLLGFSSCVWTLDGPCGNHQIIIMWKSSGPRPHVGSGVEKRDHYLAGCHKKVTKPGSVCPLVILGFFTLCAKLSGTVYCYWSCLFATGGHVFVCLWVSYHDNSKLRASIFAKLGL